MVRLPASLRLSSDVLAQRDLERVLVALQVPLERSVIAERVRKNTDFALEVDRGLGDRVQHGPRHYWLRRPDAATDADLERLLHELGAEQVASLSGVYELPGISGRQRLFSPSATVLLIELSARGKELDQIELERFFQSVGLAEIEARSNDVRPFRYCVTLDPVALPTWGIADSLRAHECVRSVRYDLTPLTSPFQGAPANETYWPQQSMLNINMTAAWGVGVDAGLGDPNVYICIIDNGCQSIPDPANVDSHAELRRAGNTGWDPSPAFGPNVGGPVSPGPAEAAHGTACAGIAAAEQDLVPGVTGVAPKCSIFSLAIPGTSTVDFIAALNQITTRDLPNQDPVKHRRVCLISTAHPVFTGGDPATISGILLAAAAADESEPIHGDVVFVVPTGNGDTSTIDFPATDPNVIAVGATDNAVTLASNIRATGRAAAPGTSATDPWGSNFGPQLSVVAPGVLVSTTDLLTTGVGYNHDPVNWPAPDPVDATGRYTTRFSGTSAAAAHVAGLAALLLSQNPRLHAVDVKRIIERSAAKVSPGLFPYATDLVHLSGTWETHMGYGMIDAGAAIPYALVPRFNLPSNSVAFGSIEELHTYQLTFTIVHKATDCTRNLTVTLVQTGSTDFVVSPAPGTFVFTAPAAPLPTVPSADVTHTFTVTITGPMPFVGGLSGTITITTDDVNMPPQTVSLSANSIQAEAISTVLVVDRSGSMTAAAFGGETKADQALWAGQLFINLLEDDDELGIVRFDHRYVESPVSSGGDRILDITTIGGGGRATALAQYTATNIAPAGATSIGGGMWTASRLLTNSATQNLRSIVVLTDGIQNTGMTPPQAHTTIDAAVPAQRVFAVGLGQDVMDSTLQQVSLETNGVAVVTGTSGTKVDNLSKWFNQIITNITATDFIAYADPLLHIGESQATVVPVSSADRRVDFVVFFVPSALQKKYLELWLEAPDGTLITAQAAGDGDFPTVEYRDGLAHALFRVTMPAFPTRPSAHIGQWKVWASFGGDEFKDRVAGRSLDAVGQATQTNTNATIEYSVWATSRSDYSLSGRVVASGTNPGASLKVYLEASLFAAPVTLSAPPTVQVKRPDGVEQALVVTQHAPGSYSGTFHDTSQNGSYLFEITSTLTAGGTSIPRYLALSASIGKPKTGPDAMTETNGAVGPGMGSGPGGSGGGPPTGSSGKGGGPTGGPHTHPTHPGHHDHHGHHGHHDHDHHGHHHEHHDHHDHCEICERHAHHEHCEHDEHHAHHERCGESCGPLIAALRWLAEELSHRKGHYGSRLRARGWRRRF